METQWISSWFEKIRLRWGPRAFFLTGVKRNILSRNEMPDMMLFMFLRSCSLRVSQLSSNIGKFIFSRINSDVSSPRRTREDPISFTDSLQRHIHEVYRTILIEVFCFDWCADL